VEAAWEDVDETTQGVIWSLLGDGKNSRRVVVLRLAVTAWGRMFTALVSERPFPPGLVGGLEREAPGG
jgi:hypothetical protein